MSWKNLFRRGGGQLPPDRTVAILDRYLDADFRIFPMAEAASTIARIRAIEQEYGIRYPGEFVAQALGQFPGIYVEVKEEIWPRPEALQVGPFWTFSTHETGYTPAAESESWMRLDTAAESFRQQGLAAAPILRVVGDADVYCATPSGGIARFQHETGELKPFQGGFWQLFEQEISALRDRKMRKLASADRQ